MPRKKSFSPSPTLNPDLFRVVEFPQKKGDQKRSLIIESAITCIAKLGIEKCSFEAIGKEAGLIRAHVNYYFKEKEDLIRGVLEYVLTNVQQMTASYLATVEDPQKHLAALNHITFEWVRKFPKHMPVMMLIYYYCSVHKDFYKYNTQARSVAKARLMGILKNMKVSGDETELRHKVNTIHALMLGNVLEYVTAEHHFPIEAVEARCLKEVLRVIE